MSRRRLRSGATWVAPIVGLALASGASSAWGDLETVRTCVEDNLPRLSSVQTLRLSVRDAKGEVSVSRAKVYWRRLSNGDRRLLLRFRAPEDLAHAALLVHASGEGNPAVHLYLPELGRPQRVYSAEQVERFLGWGDLRLEELRSFLDPVATNGPRLLADAAELAGRRVWIVETRSTAVEDARYARVVVFVDREYCLPLRIEFYGHEQALLRLLRIDPRSVTREGQSWVPRVIVIENRETGSESTLHVESIEVDVPLAPSLLTVKALSAGAR